MTVQGRPGPGRPGPRRPGPRRPGPGQPLCHAMHIKVYWIQHVICVGLIDEKTGYIMWYAKLIV